MIVRLLIFFVLNFTALALGGLFTSESVSSDWYLNLNKAPWTPPGWVFGAAWTTIMICFSIYMAYLWDDKEKRKIIAGLYAIQWMLNVGWNPVFFLYHQIIGGLILITALTFLVGYFTVNYRHSLNLKTLLILPYFIWLLIATSLNAFIFIAN